jgi:hypothetical protein
MATLAFPKGTLKIFDLIWATKDRLAAESPATWDGMSLPRA